MKCPKCHHEVPEDSKFCNQCAYDLKECAEVHASSFDISESYTPPKFLTDKTKQIKSSLDGERKFITVLFSDMTGYTAMSERLDPEEVKGITTRIFKEVSKVITKYDGFIEKYIGDAIVAIFGIPKAHEDDTVRALLAAKEIHEIVEAISPEYELKIGSPLSMHTGINTGVVVSGEVNMERGTHGVVGDTINIASRLCSISNSGEIVVGQDVYNTAEGYFTFEPLGPKKVKGKEEPLQIYKAISLKKRPNKIHRIQGVQADLIGRTKEMTLLNDAVKRLSRGLGSVVSICGYPGTGKSRLSREFKAKWHGKDVQWFEGHAYAYTQNTPYASLIDLLGWAFQIDEVDSPSEIKNKIESNINALLGDSGDEIPYIGSLFSLEYPEIKEVSPDFWKQQLYNAVKKIISALAKRNPTVICFEDLHWADPSSIDLLRALFSAAGSPVLFLCIYRPNFNLFVKGKTEEFANSYQEIVLRDLSHSDAGMVVKSLLKTETIPEELIEFLEQKAEGNPFYLEEVINSLIDIKALTQENDGSWQLIKSLSDTEIPSSINGLLSARLDRLEEDTKQVVKEASVIGRTFLFEILNRITERKHQIEDSLLSLEKLDLVRKRAVEPDLEYLFKHALTQEVAYNSLLKKDRTEIHKKIGLIIEHFFQSRLPEFYETLAYHFTEGQSLLKAVDYLMKSGKKSLERYALEESHKYYQDAFTLIKSKSEAIDTENLLLIDLLLNWALVFYFRGDFKGLFDLLNEHEQIAETLDDKEVIGMFFAWLGFTFYSRDKLQQSDQYLMKALAIGEEINNKKIIGYACTWLSFHFSDLGRLDEAVSFGERALGIGMDIETDQYLFFKPQGGMMLACLYMGDGEMAAKLGESCLTFGKKHSNIRSLAMGHFGLSAKYSIHGDFQKAIEYCQKAIRVSADSFYDMVGKFLLGLFYVQNNQFNEAQGVLQEVINYSKDYGCEWAGNPSSTLLGVVMITKGFMGKGLKLIKETLQSYKENNRKFYIALSEHILGSVYLGIVEGNTPISPLIMAKNIGFLIKNVPFASNKGVYHFKRAIEIANDIGAKGVLAQAYFDLGILYRAKKKTDKARDSISKAISIFEDCGADMFLKQANEALKSLG